VSPEARAPLNKAADFFPCTLAPVSILRNMAPNLTAPLSHEEFASLQEVGKGLMQRVIPARHRDRLISLGYIAERRGGLVLTNAGRMRLEAGR
jgi:hypothetical protein